MAHDDEHRLFLPRADELETGDKLDQLLARIRAADFEAHVSAQLVAEHVAGLFADLERQARPARRAVVDYSTTGVIRWLQLVLDEAIDETLWDLSADVTDCAECNRLWIRHLLRARSVISDWAWARETAALLDET